MDAALATFARYGYRKTSMDEIAQAAKISRPGLYFLFDSKEDLFRAAVSQALESDTAQVERILARTECSLRHRLQDAFGCWVGRYIGPMAKDVKSVIEDNPGILGDMPTVFQQRFANAVTTAIATSTANTDRDIAVALARTMISTSIGLKYQVATSKEFSKQFAVALDVILRFPLPTSATRQCYKQLVAHSISLTGHIRKRRRIVLKMS